MNPPDPDNAALQHQIEALRAECQAMREENAKLRKEIRQQQYWIAQLRDTIEALLKPSKTA